LCRFPDLTEIAERVKRDEAMRSNEERRKKPIFKYSQFYSSPWAATLEDERIHYDLMQKMREWPRDEPGKPVDEIQMTLMKLIIGFTPDFVEFERKDLVQEAQLK